MVRHDREDRRSAPRGGFEVEGSVISSHSLARAMKTLSVKSVPLKES